MIYLDYAANTPVDDRVLDSYISVTREYFANANSKHKLGSYLKKMIDDTSNNIAKYFSCLGESIIYTSGSSEANNLVIKGICNYYKNRGRHIIISSLEHSSIVACCNYLMDYGYDVTVLPITKDGIVDLEVLKSSLREDTILVSIASVDSELGTIQPIDDIANIVKKNSNAIFHTDATQAIGKVNINYDMVDFITFAPHKFNGLNGMGVLVNRSNLKLTPLIHGGLSTTSYRSGTPVPANIVSTYTALSIAMDNLNDRIEYISGLKKYLIDELKKYDFVHINSPRYSVSNILNFSLVGLSAREIVECLSREGVYVSTTSACSMKNAPSRSVYALTSDMMLASNSIRISLSNLTTTKELEEFMMIFDRVCREVCNDKNS